MIPTEDFILMILSTFIGSFAAIILTIRIMERGSEQTATSDAPVHPKKVSLKKEPASKKKYSQGIRDL